MLQCSERAVRGLSISKNADLVWIKCHEIQTLVYPCSNADNGLVPTLIGANDSKQTECETDLNSMTNVPTKLATLVLANAMLNQSTTLAVVKLNNTRVSINFQKPATVGTSPTRPYTIPPNIRGGTRRRGNMSNNIYGGLVCWSKGGGCSNL